MWRGAESSVIVTRTYACRAPFIALTNKNLQIYTCIYIHANIGSFERRLGDAKHAVEQALQGIAHVEGEIKLAKASAASQQVRMCMHVYVCGLYACMFVRTHVHACAYPYSTLVAYKHTSCMQAHTHMFKHCTYTGSRLPERQATCRQAAANQETKARACRANRCRNACGRFRRDGGAEAVFEEPGR